MDDEDTDWKYCRAGRRGRTLALTRICCNWHPLSNFGRTLLGNETNDDCDFDRRGSGGTMEYSE